jgi:V-type H+-transporting ATPase subunit C
MDDFLLLFILEMFKLEVPSLTVGTLDTLMNLSDDLVKTESIQESIVRKIEKTAGELGVLKADLTVAGVPVLRYIQQFAWDAAKYPTRRPLPELVQLIASNSAAIDEELKQLLNTYTEKIEVQLDMKRKSGGNLMGADWNDSMTEQKWSEIGAVDTEHLKTLFVALPKSTQDFFVANVIKISEELAGYNTPDWTADPSQLGKPRNFGTALNRNSKRGSPVVPGSVKLVLEDHDSAVYAVTILKHQYEAGYYDEQNEFHAGKSTDLVEAFSTLIREKRWVVRDYTYDPNATGAQSAALEELNVSVDAMKSALTRWVKNHYGDAITAWMHTVVIRVFCESVLRYGLPVDFTAVLYKTKKEPQLIKALDQQLVGIGHSGPADDAGGAGADEEGGEEFHEFVMLKMEP